MSKLKVIKSFKWAHGGHAVKEYAKGDVIDTKKDCVNEDDATDLERVSLTEKWTCKDGKGESDPPPPPPPPPAD